jgi:hypothetical protein
MITRNAAIIDGKVVDVGRFDMQTPPPPPEGAAWVEADEWVNVGCLYNGNRFLQADGSRPPKDHIDSLKEAADHNELLERLIEAKDEIAAMRAETGTNVERIKRLEKILILVLRAVIKLYR